MGGVRLCWEERTVTPRGNPAHPVTKPTPYPRATHTDAYVAEEPGIDPQGGVAQGGQATEMTPLTCSRGIVLTPAHRARASTLRPEQPAATALLIELLQRHLPTASVQPVDQVAAAVTLAGDEQAVGDEVELVSGHEAASFGSWSPGHRSQHVSPRSQWRLRQPPGVAAQKGHGVDECRRRGWSGSDASSRSGIAGLPVQQRAGVVVVNYEQVDVLGPPGHGLERATVVTAAR